MDEPAPPLLLIPRGVVGDNGNPQTSLMTGQAGHGGKISPESRNGLDVDRGRRSWASVTTAVGPSDVAQEPLRRRIDGYGYGSGGTACSRVAVGAGIAIESFHPGREAAATGAAATAPATMTPSASLTAVIDDSQ